jgi:hypothetical protein
VRENNRASDDEGDNVAVREPWFCAVTVAVASRLTLQDSDKVAERHGSRTFCDVAIASEPLAVNDGNWTAPKAAVQDAGVE